MGNEEIAAREGAEFRKIDGEYSDRQVAVATATALGAVATELGKDGGVAKKDDVAEVQEAVDMLDTKVDALATDLSFKGKVATYEDLPAGPAEADVYLVEDTGVLYVCTEGDWVALNGGGSGEGGIKTFEINLEDLPVVTIPAKTTWYPLGDSSLSGTSRYLSFMKVIHDAGETSGVYRFVINATDHLNGPLLIGAADTIDGCYAGTHALDVGPYSGVNMWTEYTGGDNTVEFLVAVVRYCAYKTAGETSKERYMIFANGWSTWSDYGYTPSTQVVFGYTTGTNMGTFFPSPDGLTVRSMENALGEIQYTTIPALYGIANRALAQAKKPDWGNNNVSDYANISNRPFYEVPAVTTAQSFTGTFTSGYNCQYVFGVNMYGDPTWGSCISSAPISGAPDFTGLSSGQSVSVVLKDINDNTVTLTGKYYSGYMQTDMEGYTYYQTISDINRTDYANWSWTSPCDGSPDTSSGESFFLTRASNAADFSEFVGYSLVVSTAFYNTLMDTMDVYSPISVVSITAEGTLKQLDNKFVKVDNNTIKVNANGELYVDPAALGV